MDQSPAVHILHAHHAPGCKARVDKHFDYFSIQFMTSGQVQLIRDGRKEDLQGAWIWFCYPGPKIQFHSPHPGTGWDHRYAAFSGEAAGSWWDKNLIPRKPIAISDTDIPYWRAEMDDLIELGQRVSPLGRLRAGNQLESIVLRLADQRGSEMKSLPQWLMPVLKVCEDFSAEPDWSLAAQSCGMAPTTFRRKFTRLMGCSPKSYRIECRIHRARQLLANPDLPISQIAEDLLFSDVFHFTRQFKQRIGLPPATYRREILSALTDGFDPSAWVSGDG